VESEDLE
jgi:hypothetical protein